MSVSSDNPPNPTLSSLRLYGAIYPLSESVALTVLVLLSSASVCSNFLLLIAICFRSAKAFRHYFYMLLNFAIVDFTVCSFTLAVLPRWDYLKLMQRFPLSYTVYKGVMYFIDFGVCGPIGGPHFCRFGYMVMLCLYSYIPWTIMASLAFRWFILRFNHPQKAVPFILFLMSCATPMLIQIYCSASGSSFFVPNSTQLEVAYPDWDLTGYSTRGSPLSSDWRITLLNTLSIYPIYPIFLISFGLRWDALRCLRKVTILSDSTKALHRSFIQALTVQLILLPIGAVKSFVFTFNTLYIGFSGVWWGHLGFIIMETVPLINSISNLYFIATYRSFVKEIIRRILCQPAPVFASREVTHHTGSQIIPQTDR